MGVGVLDCIAVVCVCVCSVIYVTQFTSICVYTCVCVANHSDSTKCIALHCTSHHSAQAACMTPNSTLSLTVTVTLSKLEAGCKRNLDDKWALSHCLKLWDEDRRPRYDRIHAAMGAVDLPALSLSELQKDLSSRIDHYIEGAWNHYYCVIGAVTPTGALVRYVRSILPEEDIGGIFALPARAADAFNFGPGPALQEAFFSARSGSGSEGGGAAAFTKLKSLLQEVQVAQANMGDDEGDGTNKVQQQLDAKVWRVMSDMAAQPDAVGKAVARWKLEVEDRLLGQYDVTSISGRDVPCLMLSNLVSLAEEEHGDDIPSERKRIAEVARVRAKLAQASVASGGGPGAVAQFDELLADARVVNRFRDERSLYGLLRAGGQMRRGLLELGMRTLCDRDGDSTSSSDTVIATARDLIVFVSKDEMGDLLADGCEAEGELRRRGEKLRPVLLERFRFYQAHSVDDAPLYINGPEYPPPDFSSMPEHTAHWLMDFWQGVKGVLLDDVAMNRKGAKVLNGSAAAEGVYVGRARVIETSAQYSRIQQGDVVVIPFTNSSFNVVMRLCGAIVTMHGGTLSHAGIVSREMGIACVTDCSSAVSIIEDGARVEVNGNLGTVTILDGGGE